MTRTLNGEFSKGWKGGGADANMMHITTATFGGTGYLGRYVSAATAMHRMTNIQPFRMRASSNSGVRNLKHIADGTFGQNFAVDYELDKEFVVKAILDKVDTVFNAVGSWQEPTVYEHGNSWFSMEAVNVEWPRMLARWCKEMGVLRLVHFSMVGADLESPSKVLRQKAAGEIAVLEEFPRATIIRATDLFSEDDFTYTRYLKGQKYWRVTPTVNKGLRIHQPVFAGDIAEAAIRAVYLDETMGRIAELGGPVRFTTNDILRWAAECNGMYHYVCPTPYAIWKIMVWLNERVWLRRGLLIGAKQPFCNLDWLERQFLDNVAMPERDPNLLDWEDFGIAREDLFRIEDKYMLASQMWSRESIWHVHGQNL